MVAQYTAAGPRRIRGGSRWTGERDCRGLRTILRAGERSGEKKPLDCAVRTFMIPISPGTRSPVKLTVRTTILSKKSSAQMGFRLNPVLARNSCIQCYISMFTEISLQQFDAYKIEIQGTLTKL